MAETILETFAVQILFKGDRRDLDRWEQGFKKVNMQLNSVARTAAVAGGALTAALFGVGRTILGFEQTMNNLQAILNASSEEMEKLREQALEFGSATAFSASQVGEAQTELAQGFGDVERTLKALPDVLNLASAGQLSMGEAAALVRNQMNAFGLTIDDVSHITDVLAKAATSGSTTVRELAPAFAQVASAASFAGLSIERTAAFIVALRDVGLRAEQAGTALRNVMVRLTEPEPPQNFLNALNRIGVSFEELKRLAQRGEYEDIFRRLGEAGLDAATAISLFGTEGFSAGASLTDSISKVEALTESLIGAEGWAERMRLIQEQGLPGAVAAFRSALEGLQLSLGEAGLTGWIAKAADTLRGFVVWLRNADGWVKTTMAIVLASGPVLLGLAVFLKLVTFALSGLVPLLKLARGAVWLWRNALILTRIQMGLLSVQTWWANSALRGFATSMLKFARAPVAGMVAGLRAVGLAMWGLVANPVGAAIAAVVLAIVAAAVIIRKYWEPIKAFFIGLWEGLQEALQPIKEAFGEVIAALEPLQPVLSAIGDAFGWVGDIIGKVVGWFTKLLDPVDETSRSVKQAGDAGRTTGKIIGTVLLLPIKLIIGYFKLWIMIIRTLITVFTWLRDTVGKVISTIRGLPILIAQEWDQIVGFVGDIWSRVYDTVKGWIEAIISFIKEIPGKVKDAVKDIPNMVKDAVKDIPVVGQVLDVAGGVADKAKGFLGGIGKVFTGAAGGVVPGPLGRPVPAIVHGGEMVLPAGVTQMLEGFRLGAAALPTAPPGAAQMLRSSMVDNRTVNVNITEPIVIQTNATNAREIARELHQELEDHIRNVAFDQDGPIDR